MTGDTASTRRASVLVLLLRLVALGAVIAVALGFFGGYARPLDSFSHFRAHLALGLVLLAALLLARRLWIDAALSIVALGAALVTVLPLSIPAASQGEDGRPSYTLLQMNLRWNAPEPIEAIRRIAEARPDVVALQEMTAHWRTALAPLAETYPFQLHCEGADGFFGDSALLSRRPFVPMAETVCDGRNSLAAARIDFNGVPVTVASHHQLWPWPAGQWRRLDRLEPTLRALTAPTLIAGDFNAAPWSALLATYARMTGTQVVPGVRPTWLLDSLPGEWARWAGLPIDNLLASPEIRIERVERMAATTSDHLPVLLTFQVAKTPDDGPLTQMVRVER
ncbi:endonuclease/exonuclease/phosphatase family protein [Aureimonas mangrovi]|uniref:endonuclease/exonuclease/phosphatase family protein n=1 Tax=Aureimonas mangrovi TaxID=2758041 RepID=UPI00163DA83C|nr:endonuclease/exonuclease/phosphatase family protein [Aureimonas mangrovi]